MTEKQSLEKRIDKTQLRKAAEFLVPLMHQYDPHEDAKELMKSKAIKDLVNDPDSKLDYDTVVEYCQNCYDNHKAVYIAGAIADTADRYIGLATAALEMVLPIFGVPVNTADQIAEAVVKAPALGLILREAYRMKDTGIAIDALKLAMIEGASAIAGYIPELGPLIEDGIDIATNLYFDEARKIIRIDATDKILSDYKPKEKVIDAEVAEPSE